MPKLALEGPPSRISLTGFGAVFFRCPTCQGNHWGTTGAWGHCNRPGCRFRWPRELDWLYFRRALDGGTFLSPAQFDDLINERGQA